MAQNIILKRSATPGKVPDTSSLNLGEIAINTYDGRAFIHKSGSTQSIEHVVVTNSTTTGSIEITQTGSFGELVVTQDANLSRDLFVVRDIVGGGDVDISGDITGSNLLITGTITANQFIVSSSVTNMIVEYASGSTSFGNSEDDTHTLTGSVRISGSLTSSLQEGYTWVGNENNISVLVATSSFGGALPAGVVSGSSQLTSSYDTRYALSGTIGSEFYKKVETFITTAGQVTFTTAGLMSAGNVDVFVNGVKLPPNEFSVTSTNTLDLTNPALIGELVDIEMFSAFGGTIGYFELTGIPQGIVSGSSQLTASLDTHYVISGTLGNASWDTLISKPDGIVSGSSQLTSSYDERYVISGSITQTTWDNIENKPSGIVSGSTQLTSSLDIRYALSGSAGSTEFYKTSEIFTASAAQTSFTIGATATAGNVDVFVNGVKLVETDFTIPSSHIITLATGSVAGQIINIETFSTYAVTTTAQGGGKIHTQSTPTSTWTFAHNLGAQYPNVTVYNDSNQIIIPQSITANSTNLMTLEFGTAVAGYAAVSIGGVIDAEGKTSKQQFTSSLEWRFEHNLGDRFVAVQTFNDSYEMIIPQSITLTDVTSSIITFPSPVSGWAVGTIGGGLPAIESSYGGHYLRVSETAPYTASWIPAVAITVENAVTASHLNPISQSLIPATSGAYDLGSITNPWKHIYVGTGSIYLVTPEGEIEKSLTANSIVTTTDIASGSINLASSLPSGMVSHSAQVVHILNPLNSFTSSLNSAIQLTGSTVSFLGDIVVYGTQSVINSTNVQLSDNILYLSPSGSFDNDLGIVGHYNDGTYRHGGIFRDASDGGAWKVFKGLTTETTGAFVDTSGNGFELADFKAANLYGAVQATNGIVSGSSQIDLTATTNYGTYINQAVKTTSDVVFNNVSASADILAGGVSKARFKSDGTNTYVDAIPSNSSVIFRANGATEYARINSTGLGVNCTPNAQFEVLGSTGALLTDGIRVSRNTLQSSQYGQINYAGGILNLTGVVNTTGGDVRINSHDGTTNKEIVRFTSAGNTGFGTTIPQRQFVVSNNGGQGLEISNESGYSNILSYNRATSTYTNLVLGEGTSKIGIGKAVPNHKLDVNGNINIPGENKIVFNDEINSWFLQARTTTSTANLGSGLKNLFYNGGGANEGIAFSGTGTGAASMEVRNDGRAWIKENLIIGGTITENSSLRYKENVETIKYGLDKVLQMRGVTYDKKNTGVKEIGVVAEEIYEVLPEVVLKNEEGEIDSVSYGRITAVLIEAIKEQQKQIEELKALINK